MRRYCDDDDDDGRSSSSSVADVAAASATVTIHVDDVNDHTPHFVRSLYRTTMSESLTKGASVTSVSATDNDLGVNARLTYTIDVTLTS